MIKKNRPRKLAITILAVGEGKAEGNFLTHLKSIYITRNCGFTLKICEGMGKGAKGVIEHAISRKKDTQYDFVFAMIDTDTDWNAKTQKLAAAHGISVFCSDPCLERWLIDITYPTNKTLNSANSKREFKRRYKAEAHTNGLFPRIFPEQIIISSVDKVAKLKELVQLVQRGQSAND